MITKAYAQRWANIFRNEGLRFLAEVNLLREFEQDTTVQEHLASESFKDAARYQALADGPFWGRWFA